jgi:hypothetical protein
MLKCKTCGGTYRAVLPDGTEYYHACPPLSVAELQDGLDHGTVTLSTRDAARLQAAQDADAQHPPAKDAPSQAAIVLGTIVVERPQRRDENVTGRVDAKGRSLIKAGGQGADVVAADA